jgi:hypothetical protein
MIPKSMAGGFHPWAAVDRFGCGMGRVFADAGGGPEADEVYERHDALLEQTRPYYNLVICQNRKDGLGYFAHSNRIQ